MRKDQHVFQMEGVGWYYLIPFTDRGCPLLEEISLYTPLSDSTAELLLSDLLHKKL